MRILALSGFEGTQDDAEKAFMTRKPNVRRELLYAETPTEAAENFETAAKRRSDEVEAPAKAKNRLSEKMGSVALPGEGPIASSCPTQCEDACPNSRRKGRPTTPQRRAQRTRHYSQIRPKETTDLFSYT